MLLWPPASHTAPTATFVNVRLSEPSETVSSTLSCAGCGGSITSHLPLWTTVLLVAASMPEMLTVIFVPSVPVPNTLTGFWNWSTMLSLNICAVWKFVIVC